MPQGNSAQSLNRIIHHHEAYRSMASEHSATGLVHTVMSGVIVYMGGEIIVEAAQVAFNRASGAERTVAVTCSSGKSAIEKPTICGANEALVWAVAATAVTVLGVGIFGRVARSCFRSAAKAEAQAERIEGQAQAARLVQQKWGFEV